MLKHTFVSSIFSLAIIGSLPACHESKDKEKEQGPIRISWPESDRLALRDTELPPFDIEEGGFAGSGRFNSVFWIDFDGADVSSVDSFIVGNAGLNSVTIPAFSPSDINSNQSLADLKFSIMQDLATLFPDVDLKLTVTRPLAEVFSRVHVGGDNFTKQARVLGIAPLDLGNRIGNDVLYVFPKQLSGIRDGERARVELTHAIAHEIAHSLGARHIENQNAIMRTSVSVDADTFNLSGPVTNAPKETENSLQVLLQTAGSRSAARADRSLPSLVNLDSFATGENIQYTVFSKANIVANPNLSLSQYTYEWEFEGKKAEGTSVLMNFLDKDDHILNLTIRDDRGNSKKVQFLVGRRK